MLHLLEVASQIAMPTTDRVRKALIGAIAIRRDGTLVSSRNISTTPHYCVKTPSAHAERRLLRKCDYGATVYVSRVRRDGSLAMAKPCSRCMSALRSRGVVMVYWTVNNEEWSACKP